MPSMLLFPCTSVSRRRTDTYASDPLYQCVQALLALMIRDKIFTFYQSTLDRDERRSAENQLLSHRKPDHQYP